MTSLENDGLTSKEALAEALYDCRDAVLAQHALDGSVDLDEATIARIGTRYGLTDHGIIGAHIVGLNMAKSCLYNITPLDEFTELHHG